jgi:hypothetical protein
MCVLVNLGEIRPFGLTDFLRRNGHVRRMTHRYEMSGVRRCPESHPLLILHMVQGQLAKIR